LLNDNAEGERLKVYIVMSEEGKTGADLFCGDFLPIV